MENTQDFVIKNGVLNRYTGPGGDVAIPAGVTEIGYMAFSGCTSLISVTIQEGVTKIGDWTFKGCTGLTSVTIPESVKEIGDSVFMNCPRLVIHTPAGSYAERYARKNGIWFQPLER